MHLHFVRFLLAPAPVEPRRLPAGREGPEFAGARRNGPQFAGREVPEFAGARRDGPQFAGDRREVPEFAAVRRDGLQFAGDRREVPEFAAVRRDGPEFSPPEVHQLPIYTAGPVPSHGNAPEKRNAYKPESHNYKPQYHKPGKVGPVYTFVKTDYHGNAKWGVRHRVGEQYGR